MFLKDLTRAISELASGIHDLASSNRQLAGAIREPEKASGVGTEAWWEEQNAKASYDKRNSPTLDEAEDHRELVYPEFANYRGCVYSEEEAIREIQRLEQQLAERVRNIKLGTKPNSQGGPQGKVLYASDYDEDKEKLREEMEEYWKSRGIGIVERQNPQNIADTLAKQAKELGFDSFEEYLAHLEAENG